MKGIDRIVIALFVAMLAATLLGVFEEEGPARPPPGFQDQERRPAPSPEPQLHAQPSPPPSPPSGPLPVVEIQTPDQVDDGIGTGFSLDSRGLWLTARHVVDGCDRVGLSRDRKSAVKVHDIWIHPSADLAVLRETVGRPAVRIADRPPRKGETGYGIGYPQGNPAGVAATMLGGTRSVSRGRLSMDEPVIAWAETGRVPDFPGSLGGLSGGPLFAADGSVIGVVVSESRRRGRFYTTAPSSIDVALAAAEPASDGTRFDFPDALTLDTLAPLGDRLRDSGAVSLVLCLVD